MVRFKFKTFILEKKIKFSIRSIGCVIYEMVVLEKLFKGSNYFNIGLSILNDEITIPESLFEIQFILKKYQKF